MVQTVIPNRKLNTSEDMDSGLWSVLTMAVLHGVSPDQPRVVHEFGREPFDSIRIILAARLLGLKAKAVRQPVERLEHAPLPAVARDKSGHYFVLAKYGGASPGPTPDQGRTASAEGDVCDLLQRPNETPTVVSRTEFLATWDGELIFFTSRASLAGEIARFDFSWFIPAIVKYRRLLGEILLVSLTLQLLGLVTPLFFQVVMDKVLVNHTMRTLNVIAVGLICATLFEGALSAIRTWMFAHTSSKIDVELGARLFRHLLALPLAYFQARRVGDSVARVRELENVRQFLTSSALTLVIDLFFTFVFLALMYWYAPLLTWIVVGAFPFYIAISAGATPLFRHRLDEKFRRGAENQAFLVESVNGV